MRYRTSTTVVPRPTCAVHEHHVGALCQLLVQEESLELVQGRSVCMMQPQHSIGFGVPKVVAWRAAESMSAARG